MVEIRELTDYQLSWIVTSMFILGLFLGLYIGGVIP